MRIITWNCKMKFREDYKKILPLNPDIVVVPECENPNKINARCFIKKQ